MNRYALWVLFGPEAWTGWALLIACVALARPSRRARTVARLAAFGGLAWFVAMYLSPMGYALIEPLESRFAPPADIAAAHDVIVLSGGEHLAAAARHRRPEYGETGDRMVGGAMLAHALPAARLWAVGGIAPAPGLPRDVDWMRAAWLQLGVAPARIAVVADTDDTCTNALGIARRLGTRAKPLLVTSAFHMPRAMGCFRAAGIEPIPYPVDYVNGERIRLFDGSTPDPALNAWRTDVALHEYVGLAYYRLEGRIAELWPGPQPRMRR